MNRISPRRFFSQYLSLPFSTGVFNIGWIEWELLIPRTINFMRYKGIRIVVNCLFTGLLWSCASPLGDGQNLRSDIQPSSGISLTTIQPLSTKSSTPSYTYSSTPTQTQVITATPSRFYYDLINEFSFLPPRNWIYKVYSGQLYWEGGNNSNLTYLVKDYSGSMSNYISNFKSKSILRLPDASIISDEETITQSGIPFREIAFQFQGPSGRRMIYAVAYLFSFDEKIIIFTYQRFLDEDEDMDALVDESITSLYWFVIE